MKIFFCKIKKVINNCKKLLLQLFWVRKFSLIFIYAAILLNFVTWIILWQLTKLNHEIIILHYNAYLGIDKMLITEEGFYPELFLVVIGGLVILLLDIILAAILLYLSGILTEKKKLKQKNKNVELDVNLLGSNLVIVSGFLTQVAIFIYAIAILFVN